MQSGNEIIEVQTYYTEPENDWVFDETQKMTYDNPVFIEQKNRKHENINNTGFTVPKKLTKEEMEEDGSAKDVPPARWDEELEEDWEDDDIIEEDSSMISLKKKNKPPKVDPPMTTEKDMEEINDFLNDFDDVIGDVGVAPSKKLNIEIPSSSPSVSGEVIEQKETVVPVKNVKTIKFKL